MKGQLNIVLMVCVGILAILTLSGWSRSTAYVLLPTLPLLASLWAMYWVKGSAYIWWNRFAIPWTIVSMLLVLLTPASGKPFIATCMAMVLSAITIVIVFYKFILPHYFIARSPSD